VARELVARGWRHHRLQAQLALVLVLHAMARVVLLGCAVAIASALWVPRWWHPLTIVGAGLGLAAFAWGTESSPQVGTAPPSAPRAPGYH